MTNSVTATTPRAMHLAHRLRSLTVAFTLAAAVLTVPTGLAHAEIAQPNLCATKNGAGYIQFWLPGETVVDKDGNKWVCGPDGEWFRSYASLQQSPSSPIPVIGVPVISIGTPTAAR
jgi:hypothetical protein